MGDVVAFPQPEASAEERPVLVVDLGGQYSQLIARRVRECRVYSELVGHGVSAEAIRGRNPLALVLSGGPASVYAEGAPRIDPRIYELGIPTLGICYGMQLMAQDLGGSVDRTGVSEFGKTEVRVHEGALFAGLPEQQTTWMSHRDSVTAPPAGARVVAGSGSTPIAAFEHAERKLYGVQFHPEVVHTPCGTEVLKNFLYSVADAPATWTAAAVIEEQVERIRAQVGSQRVLCALSGGVDSAVAALLVHKALGDQLTCVFVDHGLLRKDEAAQVVETFRGHFHVPLVHVDGSGRFLTRLAGVEDPAGKATRSAEELRARVRAVDEDARSSAASDGRECRREADSILLDEIRRAGLYRELWQCFAVLPAIRSVGVQGDERTYAYPIVIRAVTSEDAMTADWARLPYELLETISSRIVNEIPAVNRVALDLSSKPPSTIEWE